MVGDVSAGHIRGRRRFGRGGEGVASRRLGSRQAHGGVNGVRHRRSADAATAPVSAAAGAAVARSMNASSAAHDVRGSRDPRSAHNIRSPPAGSGTKVGRDGSSLMARGSTIPSSSPAISIRTGSSQRPAYAARLGSGLEPSTHPRIPEVWTRVPPELRPLPTESGPSRAPPSQRSRASYPQPACGLW